MGDSDLKAVVIRTTELHCTVYHFFLKLNQKTRLLICISKRLQHS